MAQDAAGAVGARVTNQVDSLIRAAQRGDQDAFEQLVRAYDQSVLRLAMNLLRSPEDARDVYQEAFLRVYQEPGFLPVRLQLSYLAVPHRDQHLPGPTAQAEGPQRGVAGGRYAGRPARPDGRVRGRRRRFRPGTQHVEPAVEETELRPLSRI